jgi:hypothetical protein
MAINQLGLGVVSIPTGTGTYITDGWSAFFTGAVGVVVASAPSTGGPSASLPGRAYIQATTAANMAGASDFAGLSHAIEGVRSSLLGWGAAGASPITISFWVYASVSGTMALSVRNGGTINRTYIADVTVNAANTWEYKTVTIPGDTTGTWPTGNGTGFSLFFTCGVGSSLKTPSNIWTAGSFFGSFNTTNFLNGTNNVLNIAGVTVFPGSVGPTYDQSPLAFRPYEQELTLCQRYYETAGGLTWGGYITSGSVGYLTVRHRVLKRAAPTLTLTDGGNALFPAGAPTIFSNTVDNFVVQKTANATGGGFYYFNFVADARL